MNTESAKEFYERMSKNAIMTVSQYENYETARLMYLETIAYSLSEIATVLTEKNK